MDKAVVIGGLGHLGSYLVPKLVDRGYEVHVISRGSKKPYTAKLPQWGKVNYIIGDRRQLAEKGEFGKMLAEMRPKLICDLVSYNMQEIRDLCEPIMADTELAEQTRIIQIGSIWIYGYKLEVPVNEEHVRNGLYDYGINKAKIEQYLLEQNRNGKLKATIIHPGHISGRGWLPINPQGNLNPKVYQDIINGNEILLPNDGSNTLHHVHSEDIARLIESCLDNPDKSVGEVFHAVTQKALTLRGFAEMLFAHYGHEARIRYVAFEEFNNAVSKKDATETWDHVRHSPVCSMEKAEKMLGFIPKYSSIETIYDALDWQLKENSEFSSLVNLSQNWD